MSADNESYSNLVDLVLGIPELNKAVDKITSSDTLNLVTRNWKDDLANSFAYQEFQVNPAKRFRKCTTKSEMFNVEFLKTQNPIKLMVLIRGRYLFDKKTGKPSIRVFDSEPLKQLCRVMTNDKIEEGMKTSNEFRFFMDICHPLTCRECKRGHKIFQSQGFKVPVNGNPCICNCQIFDGGQVLNRFMSQIKDNILLDFIGITKVEIKSRYFYKGRYEEEDDVFARIGGNITHLLAFPESKLKATSTSKINLGDFDFTVEEEEPKHMPPSGQIEYEDEILSEENEEVVSLKRSLDVFDSLEDDGNLIEALPKHFKRSRLETEEPSVSVEETVFFLE